jgi:hypothetical protein
MKKCEMSYEENKCEKLFHLNGNYTDNFHILNWSIPTKDQI